MRVLVVEDETNLANALAGGLRREGYAVDVAFDGVHGHEMATVNDYDLILLDLSLPGMDGLEICRKLRDMNQNTIIMMLTARGRLADKVSGLDTGADDYIVKPFDFPELLARMRALVRRDQRSRDVILRWGKIRLDGVTKAAWYDKRRLELTRKEFGMLEYLMIRSGGVVSAEEFLEHVWDARANYLSNSVKVHIHSLRQKLADVGATSEIIETVVGQGYRLAPSSEMGE